MDMPITTGLNHVAFLTTDMNKTVSFYEQAFEGVVVHEMKKTEHHPWMKIVDIGGGAMLNIFHAEDPAEIIGNRRQQGGRGAVDHFAFAVASLDVLREMKDRLESAGAQEVGEVQQLGGEWSLFFRDIDGLELEVCCPAD